MESQSDIDLQKRVQSVAENLKRVMIGVLATVNDDASPHASPVFLAFDEKLQFVWSSNVDTQHSRNVEQNGQVFITIFDSVQAKGGGLYVEARARKLTANDAIFTQAFHTYNQRKQSFGAPATPEQTYQNGAQCLYIAEPLQLFVNQSRKDASGVVVGDERREITAQQLTAHL